MQKIRRLILSVEAVKMLRIIVKKEGTGLPERTLSIIYLTGRGFNTSKPILIRERIIK
jgi:hypothetical protein